MKKLIYFDNSATSNFKPLSVKFEMLKQLNSSANPGRSGHKLSIKKAQDVWKTREIIARHFNVLDPSKVIFTKNCTEALNIAILGLLNNTNFTENQKEILLNKNISLNNFSLNKNQTKKHIITSCFEHNSILRPLNYLKEQNKIDLTILTPKRDKITVEDIKQNIKENTYLVCLTAISNVIGNKNDIEDIGLFLKEKNILFLVDFAQGGGHIKIDMQKYNINYLCFAGHKGFLSPQGIGCLVINSKILPSPIIFGGTGTESNNLNQPTSPPESLESGTLMTQNILCLKKGIEYVEKNFEKNNRKIKQLSLYLLNQLFILQKEKIVDVYSNKNCIFGVIAFNITNIDSTTASEKLDKFFNIAVRGGLHCAPLTHKYLDTTQQGAIRVSLNFKNSKNQIDYLIKAIKKIKSNQI